MASIPTTMQERIPMPIGPTGRPEPGGASALSAGDVIRVLKQRVFLIFFVWILVSAIAVGVTFLLVQKYPLYRASSAIKVESPYPQTPMELERQTVQVELMDRWVADQAEGVKNPGFLQEVVDDAGIRETSWFRNQKGELQEDKAAEAHKELTDKLAVRQIPETSYLAISFRTKLRQDAPRIVNTVISRYLEKVRIKTREAYTVELGEVEKEEKNLLADLEGIRNEKQVMIESDITAPGATEGLNVIGATLQAYAEKVTDLETDELMYRAAWDNLLSVGPSEIAINPEQRLMIENDRQVVYLRESLSELDRVRTLLLQQGLGENHRDVQNIETEAQLIEQKLQETLAEKESEVREFQINQAQTMYLNSVQALMQLRERVLESEDRQRDLDSKLAKYRILEEDQFLKEDQLSRIRDYKNQLQMIINAREAVRVSSMGQALVPKQRDFPRWEHNVPAGVLLGLLLGVGLAMLLEFVDTSIKTSRDVTRHMHTPVLGTVPDLDDDEVELEEIELAAAAAPRSMTAEAFRSIRTNLLLSSPEEKQRSVLVTSAQPEEGKTAVAVNLAIVLAQGGKKVLLVDANLHQPMLRKLFPKTGDKGLSTILIGQDQLADSVSPSGIDRLDVLPAGPIPPNPAELLGGEYFRKMIDVAKQTYDQIIIDGPPVLLMSDVLAMCGTVNGLIMVCRAKISPRGAVQRAKDQIDRVNGHMFGAVLNGARVARGGYFREQIRTYYDYQPEGGAEVRAPSPDKEDNQG